MQSSTNGSASIQGSSRSPRIASQSCQRSQRSACSTCVLRVLSASACGGGARARPLQQCTLAGQPAGVPRGHCLNEASSKQQARCSARSKENERAKKKTRPLPCSAPRRRSLLRRHDVSGGQDQGAMIGLAGHRGIASWARAHTRARSTRDGMHAMCARTTPSLDWPDLRHKRDQSSDRFTSLPTRIGAALRFQWPRCGITSQVLILLVLAAHGK